MFSFETCLFLLFAHIFIVCFVSCLLICQGSSLEMLDIRVLSDAQFANIFSHSVGCLFTLLIVSFAVQMLIHLIRSHLSIFDVVAIAFGIFVLKSLPIPISRMTFPRLSSRVFIILGFTFKSLIHLSWFYNVV